MDYTTCKNHLMNGKPAVRHANETNRVKNVSRGSCRFILQNEFEAGHIPLQIAPSFFLDGCGFSMVLFALPGL